MNFDNRISELEKELESSLSGFSQEFENIEVSHKNSVCNKHGEFKMFSSSLKGVSGFKSFKRETRCPDCIRDEIDQLKKKKAEYDRQRKNAEIENLKDLANIPKRFAQSSFDNYLETKQSAKAKRICKAYADRWQDRKASGGGLILCGKPGTGKNHLACAIINQVIEQHQDSALLTTALRIVRKIKSTWNKDSDESEADAIHFYINKELLVIDEIGVQFGSESEKIILFEIINGRYEEMKPTILISNLSENELSDYTGERVVDRMREGGGAVIAFDWESYRK